MDTLPFLSLIIPAHNEEHRLPATLERVLGYLGQQEYSSEILVVENGSQDRTAEVVQPFLQRHSNVRMLREARRGKGLAVRRGMLQATGKYRFLCDADLSMPIEELHRFLPPVLSSFDIAIGSREVPGSVRFNEPVHRHWIGRAFNLAVRLLAVPGFQDTQCGFKCFLNTAADDLFAVQQLDGLGFDVEVLFIALRRGYRVVEVPIPWYFDPDSRVRLFQDSFNMFRELFVIRRNWHRGLYGPQKTPAL